MWETEQNFKDWTESRSFENAHKKRPAQAEGQASGSGASTCRTAKKYFLSPVFRDYF